MERVYSTFSFALIYYLSCGLIFGLPGREKRAHLSWRMFIWLVLTWPVTILLELVCGVPRPAEEKEEPHFFVRVKDLTSSPRHGTLSDGPGSGQFFRLWILHAFLYYDPEIVVHVLLDGVGDYTEEWLEQAFGELSRDKVARVVPETSDETLRSRVQGHLSS